jgi:RHS repeat-associated protein
MAGAAAAAGGLGSTYIGDGINFATGNGYFSETDYTTEGPLPLVLARHYNSITGSWRMSYSRSITYAALTEAIVTRDNGQELIFTRGYGQTEWTPPAFSSYRLHLEYGGSIATLTTDDDETEVYRDGRLISYSDRAGLTLTFAYDGQNRLTTITDPFGRTLTYFYNDAFHPISGARAPDGSVYTYGYEALAQFFTSVTYPSGAQRRYLYENWNGPFPFCYTITGVVDENGSRYASYSYDYGTGRVTSTKHAGGAESYSVEYAGLDWNDPNRTSITTPLGASKKFEVTGFAGLAKHLGEWRACSSCSPNGDNGQSDANTYDNHANLKSHTDFNGNRTTYEYDEARNLPKLQTLAAGTPLARTITTRWHPNFRLPEEIKEDAPGTSNDRTSSFTYDAKGNLKTSKVAVGSSTSTRSYTYDVTGRFLTEETDPRGFKTRYAYDMTTGNLTSVTNALGHVSQYLNYDANGRPHKIKDPNNVETTLTYDFRGQITSRVTLGQTTRYTYDKAGQLTKVEEPSGAATSYDYDDAHRLTTVTDRFGNRTVYTLDAAGNRTKEEVFAAGSTVAARTHRRVYDGFGRLRQDIDASGHVSTVTYDANDNIVGKTDPYNYKTSFAYDELNRLEEKTEPQGSARTRYGYDVLGRLASVTDPRNLVTSYTNNWLDHPDKITSPDTGVTVKTYDAAGNVKTSKDARGQTTTYEYDALNRQVKATHADGSVIIFGYDQGANGKGHRTSMSDPTGTTSWTYDGHGHVIGRTQTVGAVTLTTSWTYDATTGRLTGMTYPSGYKILYTYDAGARVTRISLQAPGQATATAFIDQIAYSPFGPVASWRQAASNSFYGRSFDRDGRISGITPSIGYALAYAYDNVGRLKTITQNGATQTFSYDRNGRLTSYQNGAATISYGYDLSGNRTSDNAYNYTISPTSNRIANRTPKGSTTAQTLFYDAAGGMENNGQFQLRYDERNRLDRVIVGGLTTSYGVNGLGERTTKDGRPTFGVFEHVYDLSGQLLGIYKSGALDEEIVWLGALPVGTIQGGAAYSIAPDHLGAPYKIVNSANAQVWFWDHDPFGNGAPTAAAGFWHRLRFPGQVYDSESKLHSNGQRDYDPRLGRYLESDPIGLDGGINSYAYANNNPVNSVDPTGTITPDFWWDAFNLGLGVSSFVDNYGKGNYLAAGFDGLGLGVDLVAAVVPVVPGGAATAIAASRAAAEIATPQQFAHGSFSIRDWSGYPAGLPKPEGPFRLLEGQEYAAARGAANQANRALHAADSTLNGLQIHEIQPVKFGGSPTDPLNKVPLTPADHASATTWWNRLQRDLQSDVTW